MLEMLTYDLFRINIVFILTNAELAHRLYCFASMIPCNAKTDNAVLPSLFFHFRIKRLLSTLAVPGKTVAIPPQKFSNCSKHACTISQPLQNVVLWSH